MIAACDAPLADEVELGTKEVVGSSVEHGYDSSVALMKGGSQFCSGTVIAPRVVLTAAHCLPPYVDIDPFEIRVGIGVDVRAFPVQIPIVDWVAHPLWNEHTLAYDVGLIALWNPSSAGIAFVQYEPLESFDLTDASAVVVGYGSTGTAVQPGVRRSAVMDVKSYDDFSIYLERPGEVDTATCHGDSGGGLFLDVGHGPTLVGVHSASNCSASSRDERVDVHAIDFIEPFVLAHAAPESCELDGTCRAGCGHDPDCDCSPDGECADGCLSDPDCYAQAAHEVRGGCTAASRHGSPLVATLLVVLLAVRVRRNSRQFAGADRDAAS